MAFDKDRSLSFESLITGLRELVVAKRAAPSKPPSTLASATPAAAVSGPRQERLAPGFFRQLWAFLQRSAIQAPPPKKKNIPF